MGNIVVLSQSGAVPEGALTELTLNKQRMVSWTGGLYTGLASHSRHRGYGKEQYRGRQTQAYKVS